MKTSFFLLLSFICLWGQAQYQYTNLKFENLSTTEGLSSSTSTEIFQDSDGFLWFGTIDGLNKYNGYTFTVYRPILNDDTSISSNRINAITEDKEGKLWIGTSNGLNVLDKYTEKFTRISFGYNEASKERGVDVINTLFYDKDANAMWIGTKNGLYKLLLDNVSGPLLEDLTFTRYTHIPNVPESIDNNDITGVLKDKEGDIWISTEGQYLNRYIPASMKQAGDSSRKIDKFQRTFIDIPKSFGLDHLPKKILEDKEGNFWIGNDLSGLVLWDRKSNLFKPLETSLEGNIPIFDIYQDSNGTIWIATDGHGLYLFDKKTDSLQHIEHDPSDPFSLPNNQPSKILEDKEGTLWIASYNKGVSKLALYRSSFEHYFYRAGNPNSLSAKIAQSVIQTADGKIWIGTDGGGLSVLDEKSGRFQHFRYDKDDRSTISSDKIVYLYEGHDGTIWVCTWDGGLNKFNPKTKKAKRFLHDLDNPYSIGQNTAWCAVEDNDNRLWIGTQTAGLNLYDPDSERFYEFRHKQGDPYSIASDFVFHLYKDSKSRLLIGTSSGLSVLYLDDYKRDTDLTDFKFHKVEEKSIKGNRINYITEDHQGNIWLGTDIGMYMLDPDLKLQRSYSTLDGLPNNLVVGIEEDDLGNIWITTKSGLSRLNPETREFKNYNTHDGLQGMEFQSKSIDKAKDGRIIVGGINGLNIFHPREMGITKDTIQPMMTQFMLFNQLVRNKDTMNGRVLMDKPIAETEEIRLKYNENQISLGFVALHYQNPERVQYAYKMEGLDKNWIYTGTDTKANYSNLAAGDYVFKVKASVNDTWENASVSQVAINILPPPWKTWWAYFLYAAFGFIVFWGVMRYYTGKIREDKERELDQMKLRFFINVSHEFRTPLTLILNPVEKILARNNTEDVKDSALTIQRSTRRLLNLTNQLLDFRKMEQGKMPLEVAQGDIVKFCKDIFVLFSDMANKKGIEFNFNATTDGVIAWFDPDKTEKIITNLLSNAIKYTDDGGSITLSLSKIQWKGRKKGIFSFFDIKGKKEKNISGVEIKIEDTGIGFRKKHLKDVFSRFFHTDHTKTGTGIGLNFTKGLVELHGGDIHVESEYKRGSTFIVRLPVDSRPYAGKNVNRQVSGYEYDTDAIRSSEYDVSISRKQNKSNTEKNSIEERSKKPVILIVEDNKELRDHLRDEFKNNYRIKQAVDGKEGVKKARKFFPDIIISDVMMPKMGGFELCRTLKDDLETCHIPILLLTARSLAEDKVEGYKTGADGYLPKPFHISVLKARINNLLEARKRLREKYADVSGVISSEEITTNSLDEAFLDKSTKIIHDNIGDPDFDLKILLKEIGMSRSHFYRKINSLTGCNPSGFIRNVRLKYASEQLLKGTYSVKEVAFMCGFNSSAYFSKTFRELFGMAPNEFVESNKKTKYSSSSNI
ncbi:ATP-binding protein [Galbibacter sp. EGI 63066]|uniref:hybrid sensor histidine kinase/response regulator transcription factor n=1 Tax=Galbibacter sp. EGI 63066 TaxID=2993559 RepID=UPI002248A99B|nr:hybrid sensor histidine kinase/response regulator transcription factor [Galbibacter sp. EGI 63066]MCX2678656.1 ATP-binding protein [Galbibacter sp. EGI 63066]